MKRTKTIQRGLSLLAVLALLASLTALPVGATEAPVKAEVECTGAEVVLEEAVSYAVTEKKTYSPSGADYTEAYARYCTIDKIMNRKDIHYGKEL